MRVVIADDALIVRAGVAHLVRSTGLDVVGFAGDVSELLEVLNRERPDVAVVDIRMPPTFTDEGIRAAEQIRADHPSIGILLLSQYVDPSYAMRLLDADVRGIGYLLKDRVLDASVMLDALRRVADGDTVVDSTIVAALFAAPRRVDPLAALSPREREVLALVAEGLSNHAIAQRMFVNERTVEAHVSSVLTKLDINADRQSHRRVLAVLRFMQASAPGS